MPEITDFEWIKQITKGSRSLGSDTSYANIFLLRNKYHIEISFYKSFLLRKYQGKMGRAGYGYPIGSGNVSEVLNLLRSDAAKNGMPFTFCLLDEQQRAELEKKYPGKFNYTENDADSDYIYMQQDLALLKGRRYHKKKNHVSGFERKYTDYRLEPIHAGNINDAVKVAQLWYEERMDQKSMRKSQEYIAIKEAAEYFEPLELSGGILYVNDNPVAMTMASAINDKICDIHFEKAIGGYADNGAYAAINQKFAQYLDGYEYINREEDIGIEGLRKAKMSYHPVILLRKTSAVERSS